MTVLQLACVAVAAVGSLAIIHKSDDASCRRLVNGSALAVTLACVVGVASDIIMPSRCQWELYEQAFGSMAYYFWVLTGCGW